MPDLTFILLNGPPYSGKDTFAATVKKHYGSSVTHRKFSAPLKQGLTEMFRLTGHEIEKREADKGTPSPLLGGMSWRDAQIWLSEEVMKPRFGADIFGRLLCKPFDGGIDPRRRLAVVSDSGFITEAQVVRDRFGAHSVHVVELHKPGCSFKGDSRSHWSDASWNRHVLHNDGDLEAYKSKAIALTRFIMRW